MTVLPCIGIDPGQSGGAVCLEPDGRTVRWAVGWRHRRRKSGDVWVVSVRWSEADTYHETACHTLADVAECVACAAPDDGYRLAIEGLFGRGPSLITLAEAAGLMRTLERWSTGPTWRPRSAAWRRSVLGIEEKTVGAKASEGYALALAPTMFDGLGELVEDGHVVEAACIARDGLTRGWR